MVEGEEPGGVEELYAIDVFTGEVPNTDVADSINPPREQPGHVHPRMAGLSPAPT
jgi:hypothetical protein